MMRQGAGTRWTPALLALWALLSACSAGADSPATGAQGGEGGGGGAEAVAPCDCGDDPNDVHVPLDCACEHDLCSTFADDLELYQTSNVVRPSYVLLGTCDGGYRTLSYAQAGEQSGTRTYAASGDMVYDSHGGYYPAPSACGVEGDGLGHITIGDEDPATGCALCLLVGADDGQGGAGGTPYYPELQTPPCTPADLE